MPLFNGYGPIDSTADRQTRTNNVLFRSDLEPTYGPWLADPRLPHKFQYHFAGQDPNWVVIPKGTVVSLVAGGHTVRAFPSGKEYPAVTIANGGSATTETNQEVLDKTGATATYSRAANIPVGIADRNIFKNTDDTFYGNEVYFRRYGYIELPLIPNATEAAAAPWGCVSGDVDLTDYVMPTENGKLTKWKSTDGQEQKVAQVLFINKNIPPEGWLEWYKGGNVGDHVNPLMANHRPEYRGIGSDVLLDNEGYPYNPYYGDVEKYGTGIPGLTDGSRIETEVAEEVIGVVPETAEEGDQFHFFLKNKPLIRGTLTVTMGEKEITPEYYDPISGLVLLKVVAEYDGDNDPIVGPVKATYKVLGHTPGLPTNWDFKGAIGVVGLSLCFGR